MKIPMSISIPVENIPAIEELASDNHETKNKFCERMIEIGLRVFQKQKQEQQSLEQSEKQIVEEAKETALESLRGSFGLNNFNQFIMNNFTKDTYKNIKEYINNIDESKLQDSMSFNRDNMSPKVKTAYEEIAET